MLELDMGDIGLELHPNPEPILILFGTCLIEAPLVLVVGQSRLVDDLLCDSLAYFGVFPDHDFQLFSVTESDYVVSAPVYCQDGLLVLSGEHYAGG